MATRRPTFNTGKPSIPTPRANDLRNFQQAIDNIRERFANAEAQLAFLQSVADANVGTGDLTLMKQQLAALTSAVNVLVAGGNTASAPDTFSFAPGSFTVATGKYAIMSRRLQLTGSQRATLAGTSRLRIT